MTISNDDMKRPGLFAGVTAVLCMALAACSDSPSGDDTDLDTDANSGETFDAGEPTLRFGALSCDAAVAEPETFAVGAFEVRIASDGEWSVHRSGEALALIAGRRVCEDVDGDRQWGWRVGRGEPGVFNDYGAFDIELVPDNDDLYDNEPNIEWFTATSAPLAVATDGGVSILAQFGEHIVALEFSQGDGEDIRIGLASRAHGANDVEGDADVLPGGYSVGELNWQLDPESSFFGLGTQSFGMDLRGGRFPLWTQEQGIGKVDRNPLLPLQNFREAAYAPMGIWHSSSTSGRESYSAIVDHDGFHELDLGQTDDSLVTLRSYPELPAFVLVQGVSPRDRLTRITDYTGRQLPVPDWAFGPWNDAVGGAERLNTVASTLRANDVPSSAIWAEDWIGGEQTINGFRLTYAWEWSESTYPTLPEEIESLHENGFAFLGYFNSFVPDTTRMWTEGVEGGFLMQDSTGEVRTLTDPAFRTASLVELTNPDAVEWLSTYLRTAARDLALDGWMADFSEWYPVDAVPPNGESAWMVHNRYPLIWQQTHTDAMNEVHANDPRGQSDWVYFARSGWASTSGGSSGTAPILWGGDQDTDWDEDDGYPTIAPIAANVGLAGVGLFGSDIAGYSSVIAPNTTKELFLRWSSAGAFHPIMRTHHGSDKCSNWSFDRDEETLAHYRRWAGVHTRLLPTWRALTTESQELGWPVTRHPWFVEPSLEALWSDEARQFFIGDTLLVAPVWDEGASEREVLLPANSWWPLFGSTPVEATASGDVFALTVQAGPTELPVFVRPGTALVLLPRVVDSLYGASAPGVSTLESLNGALMVALYPDENGDAATTGDLEVTATGLVSSPNWVSASWNGEALVTCMERVAPCLAQDGVRLTGPGELTLSDGGSIVISGDAPAIALSYAGDAWGEQREPTLLTDLTPDIPPPCDE
ncbi:MAG: alpha-glucosidase [Bradymonadia bacterium]|jgi:alpha-glucosidase